MFSREQAVEIIKEFVVNQKDILTAWEGGSTATGYADEYSDLDLYLITKNEVKETVLTNFINFLTETFGEKNMFRLPEPAWHGCSQVFFNPDNTPELFYIDFLVIGEDIEDKLTEENRHGISQLWKEEYKIDTSPRPKDKIEMVSKSIIQRTKMTDFITIIEFKKSLQRGIFSEAFPNYMSFIARLLVPLMNIQHRPEKADFGMRYIYRDYPKKDYAFIEDALRVSNMEEMRTYSQKLLDRYESLKNKL